MGPMKIGAAVFRFKVNSRRTKKQQHSISAKALRLFCLTLLLTSMMMMTSLNSVQQVEAGIHLPPILLPLPVNRCEGPEAASYGSMCHDTFPQVVGPDFVPEFNSSGQLVPLNMTDCKMAAKNISTVAICNEPSWQEIKTEQIPSPLNYLLVTNTSIRSLLSGSFRGKAVMILDVSDNPIKSIDDEAFLEMHGLQSLLIRNSNFQSSRFPDSKEQQRSLPFFTPFRYLVNLRNLILENNNICLKGVDEDVSSSQLQQQDFSADLLPNLTYLSLKNNPLGRIENLLFYPLRKSPLEELNLNNCHLESIAEGAFKFLKNLKHIDLYRNPRLMTMSAMDRGLPLASLFSGLHLHSLGLGSNQLFLVPSLVAHAVKDDIERLNLSGNYLMQLGYFGLQFPFSVFPSMERLHTLVLQNCFIEDIHESTFRTLVNLKHLDLRRNKLKGVIKGFLVPSLETLDLSHQCILGEGCKWNGFQIPTDVFLQHNMTRLRELRLSGLHAKNLRYRSFTGLHSLERLDLDHTDLVNLQNFTFSALSNLKVLNMSFNSKLRKLPRFVFDGLNELRILDLSYSSMVFHGDDPNEATTPHYYIPATFQFRSLRVLNLTCSLHPDCGSPYGYETRLDANLLKRLPALTYLDLSENGVAPWTEDIFLPTANLRVLLLRKNQLIFITVAMMSVFKRVKVLDLRENPVTCDQQVASFYEMSLERPDLDIVGWDGGLGYTCHPVEDLDSPISFKDFYHLYTQEQHQPGSSSKAKLVFAFCMGVALASLVTAFLVIFVYDQRFHIGYFILTFRRRYYWLVGGCSASNPGPPPTDTAGYKYDAFISYSNEDAQWVVEELLPQMEDLEPHLQCCIHERDFKAGVSIIENIVESIETSRNFVLVLSPSFLSSKWCMFEAHLAQTRTTLQQPSDSDHSPMGHHSIILILKDQINDAKLDRSLKFIMKIWTYLEWPSKDGQRTVFWKRLKTACLPKKVPECADRLQAQLVTSTNGQYVPTHP